jgi:hypothetical protein
VARTVIRPPGATWVLPSLGVIRTRATLAATVFVGWVEAAGELVAG